MGLKGVCVCLQKRGEFFSLYYITRKKEKKIVVRRLKCDADVLSFILLDLSFDLVKISSEAIKYNEQN